MGTRGIFQVYDSTTDTYTYYYIHGDSLIVLKQLQKKLKTYKTIKSIRKAIAGQVADGTLRVDRLEVPGINPYTPKDCWPFLEYSLTLKIFQESNRWEIHPVYECLEREFKLAKYQRSTVFHGSDSR